MIAALKGRAARLGEEGFLADLLRIAAPIALQNLVSSSVNMLDTIMVGSLGEVALAAVGLGNQVFFLLMLFLFGVSSGGGVFTAQYWGKRDFAGIRRSFGLSLALGLAAAALFALAAALAPRFLIGLYSPDAAVVAEGARYLRIASLSYLPMAGSFVLAISLRSMEKVRLPLVATVISLAMNAFLNWVMIFGKLGFPALGVEGAAWATVASRFAEFLILFGVSKARAYPMMGGPRQLLDWGGGWIPRYARIVAPVLVNEIAWSLGITTYNAVFARVGTGAIAAYNVVSTVSQLAMVLFFGTASAAAVMIGKKIGEGRRETAVRWARRFCLMAPVLGLAVGLLVLASGALLPLLFKLEAGVLAQAALMVAVLAGVTPFKVFNLHVVVGVCRAGGDTKFGAVFDIVGVWGIGVPLAALGAFVWGLPAWGVFLMTAGDEVGKCGLGIWRLATGKWLRDVTV